jgi:hypothetical protein
MPRAAHDAITRPPQIIAMQPNDPLPTTDRRMSHEGRQGQAQPNRMKIRTCGAGRYSVACRTQGLSPAFSAG